MDDYFENVVLPNRGRVIGATAFIAATGMVPEAVDLSQLEGPMFFQGKGQR